MIFMPTDEDLDKLTYFELLVEKNKIVDYLKHFEDDIEMKDPDWRYNPGPDVRYQEYLDYLGRLAPKLAKAFNAEYEWGEKNIDDYYKEMEKHKKENFKNAQSDILDR